MNLVRLNLGCEYNHLAGWINIDINPDTNPTICADARSMPFFPDMSASEILASHLLEHFREAEVIPALREWNRILIPGGLLTLVVPDVEKTFLEWQSQKISDDQLLRGFIGSDQDKTPWMLHKTFFWKSRLFKLLSENNYDRIEEVNLEARSTWLQVLSRRKG